MNRKQVWWVVVVATLMGLFVFGGRFTGMLGRWLLALHGHHSTPSSTGVAGRPDSTRSVP